MQLQKVLHHTTKTLTAPVGLSQLGSPPTNHTDTAAGQVEQAKDCMGRDGHRAPRALTSLSLRLDKLPFELWPGLIGSGESKKLLARGLWLAPPNTRLGGGIIVLARTLGKMSPNWVTL